VDFDAGRQGSVQLFVCSVNCCSSFAISDQSSINAVCADNFRYVSTLTSHLTTLNVRRCVAVATDDLSSVDECVRSCARIWTRIVAKSRPSVLTLGKDEVWRDLAVCSLGSHLSVL
jgi:hypothetical protein